MRNSVRTVRSFGSGPRNQRGLSLIESLVAVLVLALGIMWLAGVQARMLAENRTTNSRAIAVSLIDDITNRMILNRELAVSGGYLLALADATPVPAVDCAAAACSNAQLANFDLARWRAAVGSLLNGGRSTVFASVTDSRQLGVMIAWPANEGKGADVDTKYTAIFAQSSVTGVGGVVCPADFLCHLVYVQP